MSACLLSGLLTVGETGEEIPLKGNFATERFPRPHMARRIPLLGSLLAVAAEQAMKELTGWIIKASVDLVFDDTTLEFTALDYSVRDIRGNRSGTPLEFSAISCPELLESIDQVTREAAVAIGDLHREIDRLERAGRPGETVRPRWMIACLWLGTGQRSEAFDAAEAGIQILHDNLGNIDVEDNLRALGAKLAEGLKATGYQKAADKIGPLLARPAASGRTGQAKGAS